MDRSQQSIKTIALFDQWFLTIETNGQTAKKHSMVIVFVKNPIVS